MSLISLQNEGCPQYVTSMKKKRTIFTKEEDKRLMKAVEDFGDGNWRVIAFCVGNRTSRQCHDRWSKFLNPSINRSEWTKEEDELLLNKFNELGPKWTNISKFFKNRTDISVKSRYTLLNRKKRKREEFLEKMALFTASSKNLKGKHNFKLNINFNAQIGGFQDLSNLKNDHIDSDQNTAFHLQEINKNFNILNNASIELKQNNENSNSEKILNQNEGNNENSVSCMNLDFSTDNLSNLTENDIWNDYFQDELFEEGLFL